MPILKTMNLSDAELSRERQKVLSNLYEKMKFERDKLKEQVFLLVTTNNELSNYASVYKLDKQVERENTVSALDSAKVNDDDLLVMNEVSVLDNADIGKEIIDIDLDHV